MKPKTTARREMVKLSDLQEHPENYNTHPDSQVEQLQASLDLFSDYFEGGQYKNVVVCQGKVLAGNGLVEAARRKGLTEIEAVVNDDLPEELQRALIVTDNASPFGAIPNTAKLEALLSNVGDLTIPGISPDWLSSIKGQDLADIQFKEYDESIADDIELCNCPTCGHEHSRKK